MHIARVGERLPRLQIQFRISRSFRPRNLANLGSKIRFWIRRKEHTLDQGLGAPGRDIHPGSTTYLEVANFSLFNIRSRSYVKHRDKRFTQYPKHLKTDIA